MSRAPVGVAMVTRNRRENTLRSLERLSALPEGPPIVVVDNGSCDGTAGAVRERFPGLRVIEAGSNLGASGRTFAVQALDTPYVAFSDDDSWWRPGALERAAELFDRHPRLGLIAARILVGPDERPDPTLARMQASPIPSNGLPGRPVLGFIACGSLVRRSAYLEVGGFERRFEVGGEELLMALDLRAAGWQLAYVDDVVAHHHPSGDRGEARSRRELRNLLWTLWMRLPLPQALGRSVRLLADGRGAGTGAALDALRGLPWALRNRRVVPEVVEREVRAVYGG